MLRTAIAAICLVVLACGPVAAPSPERPRSDHALHPSPHLALGLPVDEDPTDDLILDKGTYVVSFNDRLHGPNWVAWRLGPEDLGETKRTNDFRSDQDLPASYIHVKSDDYKHSGYDRGHLCPSAHRTASERSNSTTFLMTNMQPQLATLNRGAWARAEAAERDLASRGKVVFIVAGGIFSSNSKKIGPGIAVPDQSYRVTVVLDEGQGASNVSGDTEVYGVLLPNDGSTKGHPWTEFKVSVDQIEQTSGYDFLRNVEDSIEVVVEARE